MYGQGGKVLGCVAGAAAACVGATVLPQTGVDAAIQIALAAAAGLAAWAVVYVSAAKFGKR
jgi:LPXTG-motif cell wall-anchored protein